MPHEEIGPGHYEREEPLDLGHNDCGICEEARAAEEETTPADDYLQAELEAAEAVARRVRELEGRVADMEQALEDIRRIAGKNESYIWRHIVTVCNLALGAKGGK